MQTIKHRMDKQQGPMYHRELYTGLPGGSEVKNLPAMQET